MIRNNRQIWRIAEWLHENIKVSHHHVDWDWQDESYKDSMYDKAKTLHYMFAYNACVGGDNHTD